MHRAKSDKAVSAKTTGNKTTANTRSFKEQRWSAIYPQVALENSGAQKQNNLLPNKPVACSIIIPEFRIKTNFKTLRCWGRQKGEWVGFKHADRYWEQVKGCRSLQPDSQRQGSKLTAWTKLREIGQERLGCRLSMKPLAVLILLLYGQQT